MRPGPLRQAAGLAGLLALVPTALMLASGALDVRTAALRAVVTLVVVTAVGRVLGGWLTRTAERYEAAAQAARPADAERGSDTDGTGARPHGRRRDDARTVPASGRSTVR